MKRILTPLLAALVALGLSSGLAHATPEQDQAFLQAIEQAGMTPGPNAITSAGVICGAVWSGTHPDYLVDVLVAQNNLTRSNAEDFITISILVYCPPDDRSIYA